MSYKLFITSIMFCCFLGVVSCSEKDGNGNSNVCNNLNWATTLQDEINAVSAAAQAYGTNPTTANCNDYKNALQDYLDALEPYGNCSTLTGQQRSDWQDAYDQAQASVNSISC